MQLRILNNLPRRQPTKKLRIIAIKAGLTAHENLRKGFVDALDHQRRWFGEVRFSEGEAEVFEALEDFGGTEFGEGVGGFLTILG